MSRKVQTPVTLECCGCGAHYLTREQVMEMLNIHLARFYQLPLQRRVNGLIRCDNLRSYLDGQNLSAT